MVKLSNKGKGKPSKRKTLKTKYKIDRKVRQHKKKLRKEMRKLGSKNIKPRSTRVILPRWLKKQHTSQLFPLQGTNPAALQGSKTYLGYCS